MARLIWETAEEIDMKLAGRIRGILQKAFDFPEKIIGNERCKLRLN